MKKPPDISCWQMCYESWARDKGIILFDNESRHYMKLAEELGEVAEKLVEGGASEELSSEIGDVVATLLILVEQWGGADMRIILANSVGVKGYSLDSNFDDYQAAILRRERTQLAVLSTDRLMLLTQIHVGKLSKSIIVQDDAVFYASISRIMENQSLLASRFSFSLQDVVAKNHEKISSRKGSTINGIFVKEE